MPIPKLPKEERLEEYRRLIDDRLVRYILLKGKCRDGDHGQATVLDLSKLHAFLALIILRHESQWIETEVSRVIVRVDSALLNRGRFEK